MAWSPEWNSQVASLEPHGDTGLQALTLGPTAYLQRCLLSPHTYPVNVCSSQHHLRGSPFPSPNSDHSDYPC